MRGLVLAAVAVVAALVGVPARAGPWFRGTSAHFTVYSQANEARVTEATRDLERFDALLRLRFGVKDETARPLVVIELADQAAVERVYGGSGVAGFYAAQASQPVAFTLRYGSEGGPFALTPRTVLFHEYAHHFMLAHFPVAYPQWFTEGFAEYVSNVIFNPDGSMSLGAPDNSRAAALVMGDRLTVRQLLALDIARTGGAMGDIAYARAWALTHVMMDSPERQAALARYLEAFAAGKPKAEAEAKLGNLDELDRRVGMLVNARTMQVLRVANVAPTPPVTVVRLPDDEAAAMPLRMRVARGFADKERGRVVADANRLAAAYPKSLPIALLTAEAAAGGDAAVAEGTADRVLALDPKSSRGLLWKGLAQQARACAKSPCDAAGVRAARALIVRANRADPDDPLPLYAYARSFDREGAAPPAVTTEGLRRAVDLAPQAGNIRLAYAAALARSGRRDDAKGALGPLAYSPHGGKSATFAKTMLEALGKGEAPPPVPDALLAD